MKVNAIEEELMEHESILSHVPSSWVESLHTQMMEHAKAGRVSMALDYARGVLMVNPDDARSWLSVGMLHRELGQLGVSAKCLAQASAKDPDSRAVKLERGELLVLMGDARQGLELIRDVFLEGYQEALPVDEQDMITLRAGGLLESVQRVVDALEEVRAS